MHSLKQFVTRSRVEGLVILVVALGYLWEAHNVPSYLQIPGVPGPTTFPYLLGVVFAACGVWLLVSPKELLTFLRASEARTSERARPTDGPGPWSRVASQWHLIAMWAVILVYLWFMPDVGFPLATFALLTAFIYLLGETRWPVVLGLALVATAVIYVLFKGGLNVRLPLGVLEFLVR